MILELVDCDETELAGYILSESPICKLMEHESPTTFRRLRELIERPPPVNERQLKLYGNKGKQANREEIGLSLTRKLREIPESRLVSLIGDALRLQSQLSSIPPGADVDLLTGAIKLVEVKECAPVLLSKVIEVGEETISNPSNKLITSTSYCLSPDGKYVASGSSDGVVEIFSVATGETPSELKWQNDFSLTFGAEISVSALAFSADSSLILAGGSDGSLKVWKVLSGKLARTISNAHKESVECVCFIKGDALKVASHSGHVLRVHGLQSGSCLAETYASSGEVFIGLIQVEERIANGEIVTRLVSCVVDGTVRIWDVETCELVRIFVAPQPEIRLVQKKNKMRKDNIDSIPDDDNDGLHDLGSDEQLEEMDIIRGRGISHVSCLSLVNTPESVNDGNPLIALSIHETVFFFNCKGYLVFRFHSQDKKDIISVSGSPFGQMVLVLLENGFMEAYRLPSDAQISNQDEKRSLEAKEISLEVAGRVDVFKTADNISCSGSAVVLHGPSKIGVLIKNL